MFLWYNHPSSCTEVNCLMLLASYFSQPSWLCLIDPLKRDHSPFMSLDVLFFSRHGTSSFLCWVQGWIVQLEHKTLFHGTPTMHLWTPCYAWTTDAEPQRDTRASSEGPVDPGPLSFCRIQPLFLALLFLEWGSSPLFLLPGFPQDRKSSDKDCFHLVMTMTLCYLVHP